MTKPSLHDHRVIDLALRTADLETQNEDHPVQKFQEHFNTHYFGMGKVRTLKPRDASLLSCNDHRAMDRMHSRMALLLDMQGRRDEGQSHLAAAMYHSGEARKKKESGMIQHSRDSEGRTPEVNRVKPSPFLKALSPGDRARIRISSGADKKVIRTDVTGTVEEVDDQRVTIRGDDGYRVGAPVNDNNRIRVEKIPEQGEKSFKQVVDKLGRKRCFQNGKPVHCRKAGEADDENSRHGRDRTTLGDFSPNTGDDSLGLDLVEETLDVLSSMPEKELKLLHQRVGADPSLTASQVTMEVVMTYLESLDPEIRNVKSLSGDLVRVKAQQNFHPDERKQNSVRREYQVGRVRRRSDGQRFHRVFSNDFHENPTDEILSAHELYEDRETAENTIPQRMEADRQLADQAANTFDRTQHETGEYNQLIEPVYHPKKKKTLDSVRLKYQKMLMRKKSSELDISERAENNQQRFRTQAGRMFAGAHYQDEFIPLYTQQQWENTPHHHMLASYEEYSNQRDQEEHPEYYDPESPEYGG